MSTPSWALPMAAPQQGGVPSWAIGAPEPQVEDVNPLEAFGAGVGAGVLEPFSILPPVERVVQRLKMYGGDTTASKVGYGLGFVAGFAVPALGEYKLAAAATRGLGLVEKMVLADKVANLTKMGRFVAGATTGAMLGAGQYSDDIEGWIKNVGVQAALGGVGDVVLPAAWNALTARFGKGVSKEVEDVLGAGAKKAEEGLSEIPLGPWRATSVKPPSKAGLEAHARAMQLFDQLDSPLHGTQVVDEAGKPRVVYHGTTAEIKGGLDIAHAEPTDLYGPGLYHTEEASVASGYAAPTRTVEQLQQSVDELKQAIAVGEKSGTFEGESAAMSARPTLEVEEKNLARAMEQRPHVEMSRLNLHNVFKIDGEIEPQMVDKILNEFSKRYGIDKQFIETKLLRGEHTGESVYRSLEVALAEKRATGTLDVIGEGKAAINKLLEDVGYDGITHIGGGRTGGEAHRVWIAFNNEAVHPPFGDLTTSDLPLQDIAAKRLSLKLGLEEVPWARLEDGQVSIVPSVHGDTKELSAILKQVPGLAHKVVDREGQKSLLVALGDEIDPKLVSHYKKNGFIPGQEALWKGSKWFALRPTEAGDKVWLTQPGRLKKPIAVSLDDVQLLPIAQTFGPLKVSKVGPLVAKFVDKHGLWPATGAAEGTPAAASTGFLDAFNAFAKVHKLGGTDRLRFLDYVVQLQRKMLSSMDPELGRSIEMLDTELSRFAQQGIAHPDGAVAELSAQKGLTYHQELGADGKWGFVLKNHAAQTMTPRPLSEKDALTWLRAYGVEPAEIASTTSPLAPGVVPVAGVPTIPPHTAGEMSSGSGGWDWKNFHLPALWNLTEKILPRWQSVKFAEDNLAAQGSNFKPWTNIVLPISQAKFEYRSQAGIWLRGGTDPISGKKVEGLLSFFNPKSPSVRASMKEAWVDLLESPRADWSSAAKQLGLNEREVEAARKARDWFNAFFERHVKDPEINITGDQFIEDYWPHYRHLADSDALKSLKNTWDYQRQGRLNLKAAEFASEMTRTGQLHKWEKDPFKVMLNYMRAGLYKSTMGPAIKAASAEMAKLPVGESVSADTRQLVNSVAQFVRIHSGDVPESLESFRNATNNVLRSMQITLDNETQEKFINTLVSMNYGAYMAWRVGLGMRNLTQTLITTYPVLGARYTGYGIKHAFSRVSYDEARGAGALIAEHTPLPGEDVVYDAVGGAMAAARDPAGTAAGRAVQLGAKAVRGAEAVGQKGMVFMTTTDNMNRLVAFHGMKRKVLDALVDYKAGKTTQTQFERKAGLNYFGPTVKQAFYAQEAAMGAEHAAKFMGTMAAHDTQWLYQLGAGPALFSHGVGRLVGQYGTWPTWYASYLAQGAKNLKGSERALWLARNLVAHNVLLGTGAYLGLNLSRWTGLSSLGWMGGPMVDWFSDMRDIVTGVRAGGESTANRQLALAKYGLKDWGAGAGAGGMDFSMLPTFLGGRIGFKPGTFNTMPGPARFATSFFGMFTPGYLAARDLLESYALSAQGQPGQAMARALNLPLETAGHEWPQVTVSQ